MNELPNGDSSGYEGICPKCKTVIKTNIQGNELGTHICNQMKDLENKIEERKPYWDLVDKKAESNNRIDLDAYANGVEDGVNWHEELSNINALNFEIDALKREVEVLNHQLKGMYNEEDMLQIVNFTIGQWISSDERNEPDHKELRKNFLLYTLPEFIEQNKNK